MNVAAFLTVTALTLMGGCLVMLFSGPLLYFQNDVLALVAASLGTGLVWSWVIVPERRVR